MNSAQRDPFQLDHPPIVEVIVDIDCDLPPGTGLSEIEPAAKASLRDSYPQTQRKPLHQFHFRKEGEEPPTHSVEKEGIDSLLFRNEEGNQLTQFRRNGYSFNRLAPYPREGMDAYLPEIRGTWENYCVIANPLRIRKIGLRTINRIWLPLEDDGGLDLGRYFSSGPQIPNVEGRDLRFTNFLDQQQIVDAKSGLRANIVLATKELRKDELAVLLDIDAYDPRSKESLDWPSVEPGIASLRSLKNELFRKIVSPECLKLFSARQS